LPRRTIGMRPIGQLPGEEQARRFGDFLLARGIHHQIESEGDGHWTVWIQEEDRVAEAQQWLRRFQSNPDAPDFAEGARVTRQQREAGTEAASGAPRRAWKTRGVLPRFGAFGAGGLTVALMAVCVAVALFSRMGRGGGWLPHLLLWLPAVLQGEVWRLVTPIFVHFGVWHLLFNLLWLFQLGSMIERRLGAGTLAALVLGSAAVSNLAQALVSGPNFGGMSGVVYALAGYIWMRGKHDPNADVYLDPQSIQWLVIWLVICFTGLLGPVANTAHLVGLLTGAAWGRLDAWRAWRR
jgi:GlpG protein